MTPRTEEVSVKKAPTFAAQMLVALLVIVAGVVTTLWVLHPLWADWLP